MSKTISYLVRRQTNFAVNKPVTSSVGWLLLLCWLGIGCNRVIDSQPIPAVITETIPQSAIQIIIGQFPQAEAIVFIPLEKNHVWQVNFQQKAVPYRAVTNPQMLLVSYQLTPARVPDSLANQLRNTIIAGGTLSNPRIQTYNGFQTTGGSDQVVLADYDWQTTRYTVRWTITTLSGQITYLVELLPDTQLQYRTVTLADMPPLIQQSLAEQQAVFDNAQVQVDGQAKKRYTLTIRQNNSVYTLFYNDGGQLMGATNLAVAQRLTATSQLPTAIQSYISTTGELANFTLGGQFSLLAKTSYRGLETYSVNLQYGRQTWFMTFDGQGQLLSRSYLTMV